MTSEIHGLRGTRSKIAQRTRRELCGPPRTGKTALVQALRAQVRLLGSGYPYHRLRKIEMTVSPRFALRVSVFSIELCCKASARAGMLFCSKQANVFENEFGKIWRKKYIARQYLGSFLSSAPSLTLEVAAGDATPGSRASAEAPGCVLPSPLSSAPSPFPAPRRRLARALHYQMESNVFDTSWSTSG